MFETGPFVTASVRSAVRQFETRLRARHGPVTLSKPEIVDLLRIIIKLCDHVELYEAELAQRKPH